MAEKPVKRERKPRRRPRQSSMHFTVWTMNGEPFPEEVLESLESGFKTISEQSSVRLLSNVVKF